MPRNRPLVANRTGKPDALGKRQLKLKSVPMRPEFLTVGSVQYTAAHRLGDCLVMVGLELGKWHISISHQSRYPTWDEICQAWYRIVGPKLGPNAAGALILPRIDAFINLHANCFHVHEVDGSESGFQERL
jgi:hypothetical protein